MCCRKEGWDFVDSARLNQPIERAAELQREVNDCLGGYSDWSVFAGLWLLPRCNRSWQLTAVQRFCPFPRFQLLFSFASHFANLQNPSVADIWSLPGQPGRAAGPQGGRGHAGLPHLHELQRRR